jgi:hypothetical protein
MIVLHFSQASTWPCFCMPATWFRRYLLAYLENIVKSRFWGPSEAEGPQHMLTRELCYLKATSVDTYISIVVYALQMIQKTMAIASISKVKLDLVEWYNVAEIALLTGKKCWIISTLWYLYYGYNFVFMHLETMRWWESMASSSWVFTQTQALF